ncbi:MAG: AbrB/MazE/SpoVT family DNA-binding domain-containing protein [Thermoproteota archaeon]
MVELRVKVGNKGQIFIPKMLRNRYGIQEGGHVVIEPAPEGLLIRGRPSPDEIMDRLERHVEKLREIRALSLKLGELKKAYLEMEFEEA